MSEAGPEPSLDSRKISRAVAWVGAASAAISVIDAIALGLMLAFWVTTDDLGSATLAVTLFYFLDLATEAGLSSVLIQRSVVDDDTLSSVFWLNVLVSVGLFVAMLGIGPLVAHLQGHPLVGTMLIVYATKLLYQNVYFVSAALMRRELRFKEISIVRTVANFGDVAGRIGFAAAGEPIWCFVAGPLIRIVITGIGLQLYRPWRPRLVFKRGHVKEWLAFGSRTASSQALAHFYNNIGYQIVGYYFGVGALGVFRVAYELVLYPVNFLSNIVSQVAFPVFARLRHDPATLTVQFRRFSRQNLAAVLPVLVIIVVASNDVLAVFYPSAVAGQDVARLLCVVGMLRAVDFLYLPLLDGVGLAGRNLVVAVVAAVVLAGGDIVFSVLLGPHLGFVAVAVGRLVGYPLVISLHAYLALGQLEITARRYLRDLLGILACGVAAIGPGLAIEYFGTSLRPGLRLAIVAAVTLLTVGGLLAYFQNLSPRAMARELKGK